MCYPPVDKIVLGMFLERMLDKTGYRLPTESEWELACRAGTVTAYSFDGTANLAPQYASSKETSGNRLRAVGLLKPNAWGLFDMHDNIDEWCQTRYEDYPPAARAAGVLDDVLPVSGTMTEQMRVMRGGEFRNSHVETRSANRKPVSSFKRDLGNGFRVTRTLSVTPVEEAK